MSKPMKYDDLDYTPEHGVVDVRGSRHTFGIEVPTNVGRAMEDDGIEVIWVYASCPGWVADLGLTRIWMPLSRLLKWPGRL